MKNNIYESKSVNKLIWLFSIPSIISLILEMMTSFIDTIFAGYIGNTSQVALSSMGLISPILNLFIAFQSLYAMSTAVFISRNYNDEEERQKYFIIGIISSFFISFLVSIITFFSLDKILYFLGADGLAFKLAKQYLLIQLISNIFSSLGYILTSCIRSFGYPKQEMVIVFLAVLINVIFNFLFVVKLKLGFKYLAIGTLISEVFCFFISVNFIIKHKLINRKYKVCIEDIKKSLELFKLGFVQTLIQILGSISSFAINNSLIINKDILYLAIWNVVQKLYSIILMPIIGITQGVRNIISYYSGHNYIYKKTKTIKLTILYCLIYGILSLILIFLFGKNILYIFGNIKYIYDITLKTLKIIVFGIPFLGVVYTIITLLEVTGKEVRALILILFRQVFLVVPLVYTLPLLLKNNEIAIFLSIPIADIISFLFSILLFNRNKQKFK